MIVLDASVLIAHLAASDTHHDAAGELLLGAGAEDLGVSTITLAEVLVAPGREGRLDDVVSALQALEVDELPLPSDAAIGLARLRADTRLALPDCCVLLCAQHAAGAVASFDTRVVDAARALGLGVLTGRG